MRTSRTPLLKGRLEKELRDIGLALSNLELFPKGFQTGEIEIASLEVFIGAVIGLTGESPVYNGKQIEYKLFVSPDYGEFLRKIGTNMELTDVLDDILFKRKYFESASLLNLELFSKLLTEEVKGWDTKIESLDDVMKRMIERNKEKLVREYYIGELVCSPDGEFKYVYSSFGGEKVVFRGELDDAIRHIIYRLRG
jgi:hypothetical protein